MIASAVAITAVATAAVTTTVGGDDSTLSPADVDRLLGGTATSTPTPSTTGTVTSGPGDVVATLTPGIVTVHCDGELATLVSWSPNPGFRSDDPVTGPAATVSVRFESDVYADYLVTGTCTGGTAEVKLGPDDHDDDDHSGPDRGGDDRDDLYDDGHGGSGPG
jgi:serine/threonine-protein kinase